jgi:hypothetical protein
MQLGISNAPSNFQEYMNYAIPDPLDVFSLAYLDDNLMYGNTEEQYVEHVKWVIQCRLEVVLFSKLQKCKYHTLPVQYLGLNK